MTRSVGIGTTTDDDDGAGVLQPESYQLLRLNNRAVLRDLEYNPVADDDKIDIGSFRIGRGSHTNLPEPVLRLQANDLSDLMLETPDGGGYGSVHEQTTQPSGDKIERLDSEGWPDGGGRVSAWANNGLHGGGGLSLPETGSPCAPDGGWSSGFEYKVDLIGLEVAREHLRCGYGCGQRRNPFSNSKCKYFCNLERI